MDPEGVAFLRQIQSIKHVFGDKWTLAILIALSGGPLRYRDIGPTVSSYRVEEARDPQHTELSESVLNRMLKKLLREGFISKTAPTRTVPPVVFYALEPPAWDLLDAGRSLAEWTLTHSDAIARATGGDGHPVRGPRENSPDRCQPPDHGRRGRQPAAVRLSARLSERGRRWLSGPDLRSS